MTLAEVFRRMGWTRSVRYSKVKSPYLQLRQAAQMANAVGAPLARFLADLAEEEGIPPLHVRLILKPNGQERSLRRSGRYVRCGNPECRQLGHTKRDCPLLKPSPDLVKLRVQSAANPRKRYRKKVHSRTADKPKRG